MHITIDGESFEFQNVADIRRLSQDRAVQILEHLLFVDRPHLISEASKIPHLQENIKKLTEEREFFFREAQSIEDLSAKIVQYHNENKSLEKDITTMRKYVEDVNMQYKEISAKYEDVSAKLLTITARLDEVIQPISAGQMATNADNAAIDAIFPQCRKKPYCLRSYSNLLSFLSKPESDEFTGPDAPAAWLKLAEDERKAIKDKADQFAISNPYLKVSIKTLKSAAWKQAHSTTTVKETLRFYQEQGDKRAVDAVSVCAVFLGLASKADEFTETDGIRDMK